MRSAPVATSARVTSAVAWAAAAGRERVHERVVEILDADEEPLLDEKMYKELRRVCELADEKHKSEELGIRGPVNSSRSLVLWSWGIINAGAAGDA